MSSGVPKDSGEVRLLAWSVSGLYQKFVFKLWFDYLDQLVIVDERFTR